MKTLIAAAGMLALSTGAAFAQSPMMQDFTSDAETGYGQAYSPSEGTNYQFQPGGAATAPGFSAQNATQASDWTPNMGAGTSRTSNANSG